MTDVDPRTWANEIAGALSLGGERIPFQRVLRTQQASLAALRLRGLTWHSLAAVLLRAGVQRPDGRPYSADHLRVLCGRLTQGVTHARIEAVARSNLARAARRPATAAAPETVRAKTGSTPVHAAPVPSRSVASASPASAACASKDVSVDELAAARARLRHTR